MELKIQVDIDKNLMEQIVNSVFSKKIMLEMHQELDRNMSPYVPYREGFLDNTQKNITSEYIEYTSPYAHYQYFLHDMNADLAGVTNRTRTVHERPTSFWDKAFMMEHGEEFVAHLQEIVDKRVKELNK